jgi:hypothetical protein
MLKAMSTRQTVLSPAESRLEPSAIWLDGDLDRITGFMEDTTREREMRRIHGGLTEHSATVVHEIPNAEILNGAVYAGPIEYPVCRVAERPLIGPSISEHLSEASLTCTMYGSVYFGHWMIDDISRYLVLADLAPPIIVDRKRWGHEAAYSEIFNIHPRAITRVKCKRLLMLADAGQNSHKRARYEWMRARLQTLGSVHQGHSVWIRRGQTGAKRKLANVDAIEQWLAAQGFVIVDPEALTPPEIARRIQGARLVFGVEGSHMAHGLFTLADGGTMCMLQPPDRFNNWYKDFTDCLGLRYGFVICDPVEDGFHLDMDRLKQFLDKVNDVTGA